MDIYSSDTAALLDNFTISSSEKLRGTINIFQKY